LLASAAAAETSGAQPAPAKDWELELDPYGWVALARGNVDTDRFGNESFSIQLDELLEQLDLAAMGVARLRWRRFVGLVDFAWAKLEDDGGIGDRVRFDVSPRLGWLEVLGGYRVYQRPGNLFGDTRPQDERVFAIDALAGLTYAWTRIELDLSRDPLLEVPPQERHFDDETDFVAPYLALGLQNDFSERVRWETLLGLGAFGVGDAPHISWQITSKLDFFLTDRFFLTAGFRALNSYDTDLDISYYGPLAGGGVRF
jgi:hypothetical protein